MIDYPKTVLEILQNLKALIDAELLEREETYTEENLLRLFGTEGVWWQYNDAVRKQGELVGVDHFIGKSELPNGNIFPGMTLSFFHRKLGESILHHKPDETIYVRVGINFLIDSTISLVQIENIFGLNWEMNMAAISSRVMQTGRRFKQPTHKMGNMPIIYRLSSKSNAKSVLIELAANGNLSKVCFLVKGSAK